MPDSYYDLTRNQLLVPTLAALGGDPNLQTMGPYANGDQDTELVQHARFVMPIPFAYTAIFLANEVTTRFPFLLQTSTHKLLPMGEKQTALPCTITISSWPLQQLLLGHEH